MRCLTTIFAGVLALVAPIGAARAASKVTVLKVTTLSTMLAEDGIGEWGYAALVEVDGRRILFDTGNHADAVLRSARELGIDLSTVEDVVISHFHDDHTGGLLPLREAMRAKHPKALSRLHVAAGMFEPRYDSAGRDRNTMIAIRARFEATGGRVIVHDSAAQLAPGVWFTGPVARPNAETNWNRGLFRRAAAETVEDTVPEDAALLFDTSDGVVILTGCGHAGIMNIADAARSIVGSGPPHAVIGGLHLFAKPEPVLEATAARLKGVRYLFAAHCTGIEATFKLRRLLALTSRTAVVASVGSSFELGKGIAAGAIAGTP